MFNVKIPFGFIVVGLLGVLLWAWALQGCCFVYALG